MSLLLSIASSLAAVLITFGSCFLVVGVSFFNSRRLEDWAVTKWCQALLKVGGVRVELIGEENLQPVGTGVIYVFNHTSHFDIPVIHGTLPRSFRFGAKAELFTIPIFGWAMKRGRALRIERQNLNSVIQVYEVARQRIAKGESFILAPEGTRQSGGSIGEFKTGPFILAIQAHAKIIPLILHGADKILPRKSLLIRWGLKDRSVQLQVLKPISTSGLTVEDRAKVRDEVQQVMSQALNPSFSAVAAAIRQFCPQSSVAIVS